MAERISKRTQKKNTEHSKRRGKGDQRKGWGLRAEKQREGKEDAKWQVVKDGRKKKKS